MNISVSTWNYLCEKKEVGTIHELPLLDQAITEIVEDGFGVEIWLGWTPDPAIVERPRWDHLKELLKNAPAISLHTAQGQYSEKEVKNEIDMCSYLGGDVVVAHPGTIGVDESSSPPDYSRTRDLAEYAQAKGVILALENGELDFLRRTIDNVDILSPDGGLGICIDVGHANLRHAEYEDPVRRFLDEFREKLVHLHLADNFEERDDHLTPGDGTIEWEMVVSKLRDFRFSRFGALEINSDNARGNARRAREFLEGLWRER